MNNFNNLLLRLKGEPVLCSRCYDYVDEIFPTNCEEKPEDLLGEALGMYHCPDCGMMVLAGITHPDMCIDCLNREKKRV